MELEYVYAHGGRNGQRFVYELVFDGQLKESKPQLAGLIDVDQLVETTTPDLVAPSKPPRARLVAHWCTTWGQLVPCRHADGDQ